MADTHQRWVCPNDSWEEDARSSPLVAVPWNLLADHSRKSHGRPSLLPSDAQGLCFFRRGDLSSDHGRMFSDAALSYSSLSLHIAPPLSTVKSSLEESLALLLSLFFILTGISWPGPCSLSPGYSHHASGWTSHLQFPPACTCYLDLLKILCCSCHSPIHELSIPPLFIR